jgi:hypothetical protein
MVLTCVVATIAIRLVADNKAERNTMLKELLNGSVNGPSRRWILQTQ